MVDGPGNVGRVGRVLEMVRPSRAQKTESGKASKSQRHSSGPPPEGIDALRGRLRERVQGLALETEREARRARRIVLREILAWELGEALRSHPEFEPMVETVEATLSEHPATRDKLAAVIEDLQR